MNQIIDRLKKEALASPVVNAVMLSFAMRERARSELSLKVLSRRMSKDGFKFTATQYIEVLKLLAELGLGKLTLNSSGRVAGIKDVKVTFRSIGHAVMGSGEVTTWRRRAKYRKVATLPKAAVKLPEKEAVEDTTPRMLRVSLGRKALSIPIPGDFDATDVLKLVAKFQ